MTIFYIFDNDDFFSKFWKMLNIDNFYNFCKFWVVSLIILTILDHLTIWICRFFEIVAKIFTFVWIFKKLDFLGVMDFLKNTNYTLEAEVLSTFCFCYFNILIWNIYFIPKCASSRRPHCRLSIFQYNTLLRLSSKNFPIKWASSMVSAIT